MRMILRASRAKLCFYAPVVSIAMLAGMFTAATEAQVGATGNQLPLPPAPFTGMIGQTYKDSKSDFPQPPKPSAGAPNVLMILVDDLGFGGTGPFGGLIPTPNIDKLAKESLLYNRFHNTALCSPTRAALLSGRNHHQVGMAGITEGATGYPGYNSIWGEDAASIAEILRFHGYNTAAVGKWHDTPVWETSPAGPFDRWPTGKGFNYFYGFQGGETDQWQPQLYRNTNPIEPPYGPEQGYMLSKDMADQAISWLRLQTSVAPDKQWFMYWAPGAMHAPHHAPKEYIDRFRGKFDMGYDKYREMIYENQKKIGIIPADAKLTPRPKELPAWDSLDADQKRLYARQMEVFAGFLAYTDEQIGRLLDAVKSGPNADNTLTILILGDNGCSAEGGLTGTINNMATQNGFPDSVPEMLKHIDEIGGPLHENHFSVGWAWALDSPYQWTKQVASHFGGTRTGLIINWPAKFRAHGEVRSQFHHVVDIAPTIYEAASIKMPEYVDGVKQIPLAGVSMEYTFADANAEGRHHTQYFEIMGNRGVYQDGWIAVARHGLPWVLLGKKGDFENDKWELYNLDKDFSEADDLASTNPEKLKELQAVFDVEAKKYNVFPLDDRFAERAVVADRPTVSPGRTSFMFYSGTVRIPEGAAPNLKAKSHRITAQIEVPAKGVEGVIVAEGGNSAGYTLFVKDGHVVYENNFFDKERDDITSSEPLPKGKVTVGFEYTQESKEYGGGGTGKLFINGKQVGESKFAHVPPGAYSATETFDVGKDLGSDVSKQYQGPFAFTGTIDEVKIDLLPTTPASAESQQKLKERTAAIAAAIE
jgi:arylsulfatase A-like enzyme